MFYKTFTKNMIYMISKKQNSTNFHLLIEQQNQRIQIKSNKNNSNNSKKDLKNNTNKRIPDIKLNNNQNKIIAPNQIQSNINLKPTATNSSKSPTQNFKLLFSQAYKLRNILHKGYFHHENVSDFFLKLFLL